MGRASKAQSLETERALVEIAGRRIAADGFAAVALDDVADEAGVTRGAVYHHFGSRLGLLRAVVAGAQAVVAESVVAAAEAAGDDPAAQLRAGSHAFLDAATADGVRRVLLVEAPAALGWSEWRAGDAEHSAGHLDEALAAAGVSPAFGPLLSGAMNEGALWIAERPADSARRRAAHDALDALLDAALAAR